MLAAMKSSWVLLVGMFLLMIGNGMQGTVLGVRGEIEAFGGTSMGFVMSGYFLGFLGGAQFTPWMLRKVGHVRVFAAFASTISAALILCATVVHPVSWILMRLVIGFCFSGVYVVAESWLNDSATNQTRGKVLSAYLIVQMLGIVLAQGLLNVADPAGYDLFVLMSVAVSLSVVPMLLSASPVPVFETTRGMSLGQLFKVSPLGCVGTFLLGAVFACLFGMSSVYASRIGLTTVELSIFVGAIYVGGLVLQYPLGWMSDRMDRRVLITMVTGMGTAGALIGAVAGSEVWFLIASAVLVGGAANPLYSLLIAHTNDFLEPEDMAAASAGLITLNGVGAAGTPILVGWLMDSQGPASFMLFLAGLMALMTVYALYRMTVRPAPSVDDTLPMAPMGMVASPVAGEIAQEAVIEQYASEAEETADDEAKVAQNG